MQSFTTSTYGPDAVGVDGLETMHYERMGDVAERIDALTITKRFVSTGEFRFGVSRSLRASQWGRVRAVPRFRASLATGG